MNYLDIIISLLLLYGLFKGFSNGLIKEITGLVGLIIGVYVAIKFSVYLEPEIENYIKDYKEFVPIVSFVILFLVSILSIRSVGYVLDKFTKALSLGIISKFLGAIFGFLKYHIILIFLLFIITEYDLINKKIKKESVLLEPLKQTAEVIHPQINKHKKNILDQVEKETQKVKEKLEKIKLQEP